MEAAFSMLTERPKKDPRRVAVGALGARARWGERRHVKLTDLSPAVAAAVRALIAADAAARKEAAPASENAGAAMSTEGTTDATSAG